MSRIVPITPRDLGYIAGMFDLKGNAHFGKASGLVAYIGGVKSEQLQKDLIRWIGGGTIKITESAGDRRGCSAHCDTAHFHYTRTTSRYLVSGFRALIVLHTMEPMLHEWSRKFSDPYHEAIQRIEQISTTKDGMKMIEDMEKRGWTAP